MDNGYDSIDLNTKLAELKAEVQVFEDELYALSLKEFVENGKPSSPVLAEKARKYEDCVLSLHNLEKLQKELEQNEANKKG